MELAAGGNRSDNLAPSAARTSPIIFGSFRPLVELRAASASASLNSAISVFREQPLSRQRAAVLRPGVSESGPRQRQLGAEVRGRELRGQGSRSPEEEDDEAGPGGTRVVLGV